MFILNSAKATFFDCDIHTQGEVSSKINGQTFLDSNPLNDLDVKLKTRPFPESHRKGGFVLGKNCDLLDVAAILKQSPKETYRIDVPLEGSFLCSKGKIVTKYGRIIQFLKQDLVFPSIKDSLFSSKYGHLFALTPVEVRCTSLGLFNIPFQTMISAFPAESITEIRAGSNILITLTSLQKLINLKVLDITSNRIKDITALQYLLKLTSLEAFNNQITDITPLTNLHEMEVLNLDSNPILSIDPLKNLEKLKILRLQIYNLRITDSELQDIFFNLKSLQNLYLYKGALDDNQKSALQTKLPNCKIETL